MKEASVFKPLTIKLPKEIDDSGTFENQVSLDEWHRSVAFRQIESELTNINTNNKKDGQSNIA